MTFGSDIYTNKSSINVLKRKHVDGLYNYDSQRGLSRRFYVVCIDRLQMNFRFLLRMFLENLTIVLSRTTPQPNLQPSLHLHLHLHPPRNIRYGLMIITMKIMIVIIITIKYLTSSVAMLLTVLYCKSFTVLTY